MFMIRIALLTFLLACSFNAMSYVCGGEVKGVSIEPLNGYVFVEKIGPLTWPKLCSVDTESNGITVESCKIVYSTLLAAQASGRGVDLQFNDGKDCTATSHAPWYVLTGWYFGPTLTATLN